MALGVEGDIETTFDLYCKDYGGNAAIDVSVTLKNGLTINSQVLHLPVDEDRDGIADVWEEKYGGILSGTDDKEKGLEFSTCEGDGFSSIDEYRGFIVHDNKHIRLDPTKLEVFVDPVMTKVGWPKTTTDLKEKIDVAKKFILRDLGVNIIYVDQNTQQ